MLYIRIHSDFLHRNRNPNQSLEIWKLGFTEKIFQFKRFL